MAYPFFPATYQPIYPQYAQNQPVQAFQPQTVVNTQAQAQAQQSANNGLTWVQGIEGAKAHVTAPGVPALLMDSESERFFIKTTDASGMPMPLRIFEYKEITDTPAKATPDMSVYVTRDEFEKFKESVRGKAAKMTDGEPTV